MAIHLNPYLKETPEQHKKNAYDDYQEFVYDTMLERIAAEKTTPTDRDAREYIEEQYPELAHERLAREMEEALNSKFLFQIREKERTNQPF